VPESYTEGGQWRPPFIMEVCLWGGLPVVLYLQRLIFVLFFWIVLVDFFRRAGVRVWAGSGCFLLSWSLLAQWYDRLCASLTPAVLRGVHRHFFWHSRHFLAAVIACQAVQIQSKGVCESLLRGHYGGGGAMYIQSFLKKK
jgi:hypothetical protein